MRPLLLFCVKCAKEQPTVRKGRRGRHCMICHEPVHMKPAGGFNATPTMGRHSGKQRDSKAEADREGVLQAFANTGRITELVYGGPRFALEVFGTHAVENLVAYVDEMVKGMVGTEQALAGDSLRCLVRDVERSRRLIGHYTPDATYVDHKGEKVVEDVKGWKVSRDFPLRAKLMEVCHNLPVQVIREQRGVQQYARGAGVRGKGTGSRLAGGR